MIACSIKGNGLFRKRERNGPICPASCSAKGNILDHHGVVVGAAGGVALRACWGVCVNPTVVVQGVGSMAMGGHHTPNHAPLYPCPPRGRAARLEERNCESAFRCAMRVRSKARDLVPMPGLGGRGGYRGGGLFLSLSRKIPGVRNDR